MEPIAANLERAAAFGRERAGTLAAHAARTVDGTGLEKTMADSASGELFVEALMSAAKSRFSEIRTVTK